MVERGKSAQKEWNASTGSNRKGRDKCSGRKEVGRRDCGEGKERREVKGGEEGGAGFRGHARNSGCSLLEGKTSICVEQRTRTAVIRAPLYCTTQYDTILLDSVTLDNTIKCTMTAVTL
jgi:hypothetical protein